MKTKTFYNTKKENFWGNIILKDLSGTTYLLVDGFPHEVTNEGEPLFPIRNFNILNLDDAFLVCYLGNGMIICDKTKEENGDYLKIAHLVSKPNQPVKDGEEISIRLFDSNYQEILEEIIDIHCLYLLLVS